MAHAESIVGTASTVSSWILLEHPGPWGRSALSGPRLPCRGSRTLRALSAELGVRIVLIRRYGRRRPNATTMCFLAHTGARAPWLRRAPLDRSEDVFDLDLSAMRLGEPPTVGEDDGGPLFVTCTHGRRDPCCAERGRPVARALDRAYPERSWEVS